MRSCVILLNWNGWKDTIECLESLFRLNASGFRVIVCDNFSTDGSLEKIKEWARGELTAKAANPQLSHLSSPPFPKPIPHTELTREQAESGNGTSAEQLVLIQNGGNLGFAAGTNVGLRYALADSDCEFFWMLNNDTVVDPGALSGMLDFMQSRSEVGLCGSLNLSYYKPREVQAQGGKTYHTWTARVRTPPMRMVGELGPESSMDFVNGASMFASRKFLETVGLMDESYFLYFEELDWAMRAQGKFKLGYARASVIYHKEGAAIGSNSDRMKRSLLSDKYLTRSRVLFTKRFLPWTLPTVLPWILLAAGYRLWHGDKSRAILMVRSMLEGLAVPTSAERSK
jgi:hypothetical protein